MNPLCVVIIGMASTIASLATCQPLPVQRDGHYGFETIRGSNVISPLYDEALPFSDDLAAVKQKNKWGFVETNGAIAIPFQFDLVQSFSEGLAAVRLRGEWGYIDKQDKVRIAPKFREARRFSEGAAGVKRENGKWLFISATGGQAVPGEFDGVGEFSDGSAPVAQDGIWGFIDKEGNQIIGRKFSAALPFSDDLAAVKDREVGKYGYIRRDGSFAVPPRFDFARSFSDGYAPVQIEGRWGYINKEGIIVIEARFNTAEIFREGVAEVSEPSFGRSLYLNTQGVIVLTKSIEPESGKFAGYTFVTNIVDSIPRDAMVFMIPQPDWKRISPSNRTNFIYQATGRTKLQVRVQRMPFVVLGILSDGRQATAPFDPITATTNYIQLTDFR